MAWENRQSGTYYYRKRRVSNRVLSEYVGTGPAATLAAASDRQRQEARQAELGERARLRRADADLAAACGHLRSTAYQILKTMGFHRHKGQWRRRRMKKSKDDLPAKAPADAEMTPRQDVWRAIEKAAADNATQEDAAALRKALREHPGEAERYGDMALLAFLRFSEAVCKDRVVDRELMAEKFDAIRRSFGYDQSTPAERLLIDQVALSYMHMNAAERLYAHNAYGSISLAAAHYWERRLSATQRRYFRAVETLVRVRRLLRSPTLQVNIAADGGQQVVANAPMDGRGKRPQRADG